MKPLLTFKETAALLRVSERQVRYLVESDRLKAVNLGFGKQRKSLRIRPEAVDAFLNESTVNKPKIKTTKKQSRKHRKVNRYCQPKSQ